MLIITQHSLRKKYLCLYGVSLVLLHLRDIIKNRNHEDMKVSFVLFYRVRAHHLLGTTLPTTQYLYVNFILNNPVPCFLSISTVCTLWRPSHDDGSPNHRVPTAGNCGSARWASSGEGQVTHPFSVHLVLQRWVKTMLLKLYSVLSQASQSQNETGQILIFRTHYHRW